MKFRKAVISVLFINRIKNLSTGKFKNEEQSNMFDFKLINILNISLQK